MIELDLDALEQLCEPDANGSWYDIDAAGVSHKATDGSPYAIVRKPELRTLIQRLREAERGRMTSEQIEAEFEEMKAEFGTGEGLPEVTPEGEILWLAQHNAELKIRIAQLERVREAAAEIDGWGTSFDGSMPAAEQTAWLDLRAALAAVEEK